MRTPEKPWYRESKGAWYCTINGKQIRLSEDRAEARRKFHDLVSEGVEKDCPFSECAEVYLAKYKGEKRRTQILNAFMRDVGKIKASKVTAKVIEGALDPTWAPSTARNHIKTIIACLNYAVRRGMTAVNNAANIEKPAWERREKILTREELAVLFKHAREPFLTLLKAMAGSGCRPNEVCNLQIEHCFPDEGVWLVPNKTRKQTNMKMRPVYLNDELIEITRKLMERRTKGHLFLNRNGDPWVPDTVYCRFKRLRKKLGLSDGVIPYGTRHRFASDAINEQRIDSVLVAKLLGHSDSKMLERTYFREDASVMREIAKRIGKKREDA